MNWKRPLSFALSAALSLSLAAPALAADEAKPWYAEAQAYVMEKGLMTGTDTGFTPDAAVTRATVFQTLYNMEGKPAPKNSAVLTDGGWAVDAASAYFTDTTGTWYSNAANWAVDVGLAKVPTEKLFYGERTITRAEIATIFARFAAYQNQDTSAGGMAMREMADYDQVPAWALEGMSVCYYNGILTGKPGSLLDPNGTAVRAELAVILRNYGKLTPAFSEQAVTYRSGERTVHAVVTLPTGEGPFPAVVMNHGHGGSKDENVGFIGIARALAKAGFASIRMDFPGCGESDVSFQENTMTNMIADSNAGLAYLLANYQIDTDHLGILGYSMGGRIASEIVGAKDNPYQAAVLLSAADVSIGDMAVNLFGSVETYNTLKATAQKDGYATFTTIYGQTQELSKAWFENMESGKPLESLAKFTGPVLVLHGDKDTMITDEMNKAILKADPAAQEIIVPDADHGYGFYSDQPSVTATVEGSICRFFSRNLSDSLTVSAAVTGIEKYGHAVLDETIAGFNAKGFELGDIVTVTAGNYSADMPYLDGYYVNSGELMLRAYPGKEYLAICINYGKFNEVAGVAAGSPVTITLKEKGGAAALQATYSLKYTNDRADYASDEIFANFRAVTAGDIAEGKLYRSASPISNEIGRAAIADKLIEAAGVKTVLNLADTDEEIAKMIAAEDFASPYYKSLVDAKSVIALGMPVNYASDEFAAGIVKGLTFLAQHKGPYLIHCTEGKDRAGFTSALLEALMGASQDEIVADYMTSYFNYYNITPADSKYDLIAQGNVMEMLRVVAGLGKGADLSKTDLAKAAETYLTAHGMKAEDLAALKANLKG
ncbi:MAG: alpha/beta fold hydrolase [Pseudoflavonifractor sp.]|nr:alpha/beta fold hydrolase [Pseudoflavonifractor sp.]